MSVRYAGSFFEPFPGPDPDREGNDPDGQGTYQAPESPDETTEFEEEKEQDLGQKPL